MKIAAGGLIILLLAMMIWEPVRWAALVVVFLIICAAVWWLRRSIRASGGLWVKVDGGLLKSVPCTTCHGMRFFMNDGGRLVPIPEDVRARDDDMRLFRPRIANAVPCPTCRGKGDFLVRRPIIPKSSDDK